VHANNKTNKPAKNKKKMGREGRQFIAGHVMPDAAIQFKLLAVQQDKDVQDLLIEASTTSLRSMVCAALHELNQVITRCLHRFLKGHSSSGLTL
jgi:hypothetical protein